MRGKRSSLKALERKLRSYSKLSEVVVPGTGPNDAPIMLIGEAPGAKEVATGLPFQGSAGKILDAFLKQSGLDRTKLYITNTVKVRPPKNRDPTLAEISFWAPFLEQEIELLNPKLILTLGRVALHRLSPEAPPIGLCHGTLLYYRSYPLIPLYHPASSIYNQKLRPVLEKDFSFAASFFRNIP